MSKQKDWCTGFFDRNDHGDDWSSCCKEHDKDYTEQSMTRLEADRKLRDCVQKETDIIWANLMYSAVRAIGWIWWNKAKSNR